MAVLTGTVSVLGSDVCLRLGVTADFPDALPYVQLAAADDALTAQVTAHLESDGNICFTGTREMVFDPARPTELLGETLSLALRTLEEAWTAPNNHDILDEFASHWSHAQSPRRVLPLLQVYFTPDNQLREVQAWRKVDRSPRSAQGKRLPRQPSTSPADQAIIAVADDPDVARNFDLLSTQSLGQPGLTALYLPLQSSPRLLPPHPQHPWSAASLRDLVRTHLSAADLIELDRLLEKRPSSRDLILLGIPRPSGVGIGARATVAVRLSGMRGGHALKTTSSMTGVRLELQSVTRLDRAFILQRGGSNDQLGLARVLLLGCGALGGHLALMLAAAGIGHLTLVDHDTFSYDNSFRHALGRRFVGRRKVEGLAHALRGRYPYVHVIPTHGRTTSLVHQGHLDLGNFDLIIDATGSATHHLSLGTVLSARTTHPPALLSWLEVLGLGGHTATVFQGQPGCPRCLYSDPRAPLWNVAAFSASGQALGQDALGCGSYYTPFSDLDAIRTAEFTARRAVGILRGDETKNLLYSWKGNPTAFQAAGHQLSVRFSRVKQKAFRLGLPYVSASCPICLYVQNEMRRERRPLFVCGNR
ncbi:ThiF family adenylyltransferase, partial [Deinococcus oregonensis]